MKKYVDVIVPLPIASQYTYSLPPEMQGSVQVGCRVVVPFGKKKYYTGVVTKVHDSAPEGYETKEVEELLDEEQLKESYRQLWSQFIGYLDGLDTTKFHLHHIDKDERKSQVGGKNNFLILPGDVHRRFSKKKDQSISNYELLKEVYPDDFQTFAVEFEVFDPSDINGCIEIISKSNKEARKKKEPALV